VLPTFDQKKNEPQGKLGANLEVNSRQAKNETLSKNQS
jgi:hypothetical protein